MSLQGVWEPHSSWNTGSVRSSLTTVHTLARTLLILIPLRTLWGLFHSIRPLEFLHRGTEPTNLGQELPDSFYTFYQSESIVLDM